MHQNRKRCEILYFVYIYIHIYTNIRRFSWPGLSAGVGRTEYNLWHDSDEDSSPQCSDTVVGRQEGHPACKNVSEIVCWWWWCDWSFGRLIAPAVTPTSLRLTSIKSRMDTFWCQLTQFFLEKMALNEHHTTLTNTVGYLAVVYKARNQKAMPSSLSSAVTLMTTVPASVFSGTRAV